MTCEVLSSMMLDMVAVDRCLRLGESGVLQVIGSNKVL